MIEPAPGSLNKRIAGLRDPLPAHERIDGGSGYSFVGPSEPAFAVWEHGELVAGPQSLEDDALPVGRKDV